MVSGLDIVNTKQLVKLRKGVHATDPACPGSLINASPLCNHQSEDDEYDGAPPTSSSSKHNYFNISVIIG